jgi:hypothetical protein
MVCVKSNLTYIVRRPLIISIQIYSNSNARRQMRISLNTKSIQSFGVDFKAHAVNAMNIVNAVNALTDRLFLIS